MDNNEIKLGKYNDKIIRRTIVGLIIFLPIIFNPFGFVVFALPRVVFLYIITTFLVIIFLYSCIKNQTFIYKKSPFYLLIGVFLFFIILSTIFSLDKHTAFFGYYLTYEGVFSWLCYFILFFLTNLYFNSEKEIKKLLLILSIPLFLISLFAIAEHFLNWQIMEWHQNKGERTISFLGNPSFLGVYLVLLLPIYINFIFSKKLNWKWQSFLIILNIMVIISLLTTFSRSAWLGFVVAIIFLILINFKNIIHYLKCKKINPVPCGIEIKGRVLSPVALEKENLLMHSSLSQRVGFSTRRGVKLILIIFTILISCWLLINNTAFKQQITDRIKFSFVRNPATLVDATSGRILLWKQTINLIKDNFWFGVGPDNFAQSIPKYFLPEWKLYFGLQAEKAHNEFLNLWATMGVGAMLSYLAILIYFFFKSIFYICKNSQTTCANLRLIQGILAGIIGYLITMQFHYSSIDLAPLFWIFMGIGFSLTCQNYNIKSVKLPNFFFLNFVKYILSFASIILILNVIFFSCRLIQADSLFIKGLRAKNINLAIENLEKAIEKNKRPIDYYIILSNFYFQKGEKTGDYSNFDKSIETLEKIIKIQPYNYYPYFILGNTYLEMALFAKNKNLVFQKAEQAFKNSLKFFPNLVDTHLGLGITYAQQEKFKEALTEFKKCALINPKQDKCFFNQGKIYERQKDFKQAKEYYQKALKINPNTKAAKEALEKIKNQNPLK
ncbi:MAG: O-antigen ligase family protein [Candidatus Kuenenbacteria bacterium]